MHAWTEVCHLSQSSKSVLTGFLCSLGWKITGSLQHSLHTNCISKSAILRNNYVLLLSDLCACVLAKDAIVLQWAVRTARLVRLQTWKKAMGWCTAKWKMLLLCAKTIVKESRKFELARLKKKKKKKILAGSVLSRCILASLGVLFVMKTLEDER